VLHRVVAGTVEQVGAGVTRFAVGDEVVGNGTGTLAEVAAARADHVPRQPAVSGWTFMPNSGRPEVGGSARCPGWVWRRSLRRSSANG
jgi:threonine dehydrogenase-like Zn-dependent dehydrogenase